MRYFVDSENAATPANTHQAWKLQWSPTGVLGTRKISATPLPVSIALAGHTNASLTPERDRDLHDRARDDGGEDLRHGHVEPQLRLPEHVDRDDDRGDVQARVAQLRQHHRIGEPLDLERLRRGRHPPMMIEGCRFLTVGSSGP